MQYPVITASEPLHARYMTPPLRHQPSRRPSTNSSKQPQSTPTEGVKVNKKKKKKRPSAHGNAQSEHDGGQSSPQLVAPPPNSDTVPDQRLQRPSRAYPSLDDDPAQEDRGATSQREETGEDRTLSPGYQVIESNDEFRNVWG